jgi:dCTP deaminase
MSVKPDQWIKEMAESHELIKPFEEESIRPCISYGLSSYGYDIRLADEFKIFRGKEEIMVDPKNPDHSLFESYKGRECIIPSNSFALGRSLEYLKIPRNIMTLCFGKSTYARCGVIVNITPLEPEWEGYITIAISNTAPVPAKIYANEGIAQIVFLESSEVCTTSYQDKSGKYQAQKKITLPKT